MKRFLLLCFLSILNFNNIEASSIDKDENKILIRHRGQEYLVKGQDTSYAEMFRDLGHKFEPKGNLKNLLHNFSAQLNKGTKKLGELERNLKENITVCEQEFPIYIEFRKFERPKYSKGLIERTVIVPQLTTIDSIRAIGNFDTLVQQKVNSKTTFILDSDSVSKLIKLKNNDKNSNQWKYLNKLSQEMENLSFTFNCTTTFTEGGDEDPTQTLSLVDANTSSKSAEQILSEYEEKILIGPNALAFKVETVQKVYALFIYAPKGEKLSYDKWGCNSYMAAQDFHDHAPR